jgi:hypothetical protein
MSDLPSYGDHGLFLIDGLRAHTSPGLMLVADEIAVATAKAVEIPDYGLDGFPPAETGIQLLEFDAEKVINLSAAEITRACEFARAKGHWFYLTAIEQLRNSPGGRAVLEEICKAMADGTLPCVLASTTTSTLESVQSDICRLFGLVPVMHLGGGGKPESFGQIEVLMRPTMDRQDTGWIVAVRYSLMGPVDKAYASTAIDVGSAMRMAYQIHYIGGESEPWGVCVNFKPDAFQVSQRKAVFAAAERIALRAVGRPLKPAEKVEARRGLFFT